MLPLMIFLSLLAVILISVGIYLAAASVVRHRPESPAGQVLRLLPHFDRITRLGKEEAETTQLGVREAVVVTPTATQKRWDFRQLMPPGDSVVVTMPDTGMQLTLRVAGTARTVELFQRDDRRRDNPWFRTGQSFVFQVLKGRRNVWIFEGPGILALVTAIEDVSDSAIQQFVSSARRFGQSNQTATDVSISWDGESCYIFDIGRLGIHSASGDIPWQAAPDNPGNLAWQDDYVVKFIFAGPSGGKHAEHNVGDPFLAIIAPVFGTGGYVLTGSLIDEKFLTDVREEG